LKFSLRLCHKVIRPTLLALFMSFFPHYAVGEITLKQYQENRIDDRMEIYINGLYYGMFYSNSFQSIKERELIWCSEKDLTRTPMEIIDAYMAKEEIPIQSDDPLGMILLAALVNRYPCAR